MISGYWWLFYWWIFCYWILVAILLMVIGEYFIMDIGSYLILLY